MKIIFKISILLSFLVSCLGAKAEVGMGDWRCTTPGNNRIDNYSGKGTTLSLSNNNNYQRLENIGRWYFYKDYVIGYYASGYFIANEKNARIILFNTTQQWLTHIKQQNLQPFFWIRWYTEKWTIYDDIGFYMIFFIPALIPIFILIILLLYRAIKYEKLNVRKPSTFILLLLVTFILAHYLLSRFPQSI